MAISVHHKVNFFANYSTTSISGSLSNVYRYVLALVVRLLTLVTLQLKLEHNRGYAMTYEKNCTGIKLMKRTCRLQRMLILSIGHQRYRPLTVEGRRRLIHIDKGLRMLFTYEPPHDKTNKMFVRLAKTQISLGIRQSDQNLRCAPNG